MRRGMKVGRWAIVGALVLGGCAPSLKDDMRVSSIPVVPIEIKGEQPALGRLQIDPFRDSRSANFVAEIDGRKIMPKGDVGEAVRQAFQHHFHTRGAQLSLFRAPIISGEIREWHVQVKPSFPSTKIHALASIDVSVSDPAGKVVYRATYSGETTSDDPFPSQRSVEKILGSAMGHAIKEAVLDAALLETLQHSSPGAYS
jgi:uncharacterized lipoprotein YajG